MGSWWTTRCPAQGASALLGFTELAAYRVWPTLPLFRGGATPCHTPQQDV